MTHIIARFARCRSGATAVEYAIIAVSIAVVIVASLGFTGTQLNTTLTGVSNSFS